MRVLAFAAVLSGAVVLALAGVSQAGDGAPKTTPKSAKDEKTAKSVKVKSLKVKERLDALEAWVGVQGPAIADLQTEVESLQEQLDGAEERLLLLECNTRVLTDEAVFSYTGALQTFTVPDGVTCVRITADGGRGGGAPGAPGGAGGRIAGTFRVQPGEVLQILVGGPGTSTMNDNGGGGGGGSFVAVGIDASAFATPLLVAGGGGGGSRIIDFGDPGQGPGGVGGLFLGGSGYGGQSGAGGSGGGIFTPGANSFWGRQLDGIAGGGGAAAIDGGAGGLAHAFAAGGAGGFGGGGGCGGREGSGGGGYTGGTGAPSTGNATGGTSFIAAGALLHVQTPGGNPSYEGLVVIGWSH